jgi:hypothetical protein
MCITCTFNSGTRPICVSLDFEWNWTKFTMTKVVNSLLIKDKLLGIDEFTNS